MSKIILATGSIYRKQAFEFLGLDFVAEASSVDEYGIDRPKSAKKLVQYLAKLKTEAVAQKHKSGTVIGFDSVGLFKNEILEKPRSREEAFERLKKLSGQKYIFYTGLFMKNIDSGKSLTKLDKTIIWMREYKDAEIEKYLDQDPNFKTYAEGYDPLEHYSASFTRKIKGSYNNFLRAIPLEDIAWMLEEME